MLCELKGQIGERETASDSFFSAASEYHIFDSRNCAQTENGGLLDKVQFLSTFCEKLSSIMNGTQSCTHISNTFEDDSAANIFKRWRVSTNWKSQNQVRKRHSKYKIDTHKKVPLRGDWRLWVSVPYSIFQALSTTEAYYSKLYRYPTDPVSKFLLSFLRNTCDRAGISPA